MSKPSIAVVVLDTLRYDRFEKYFSWLDGVWFTNAYSTSHWTGSAHSSLLIGRYPSEIGTTHKSRSLDWDGTTLPEILQHNGYMTRMWSSNLQNYIWDGWERGFKERFGPGIGDVDTDPQGVFDWRKFAETTNATGTKKYIDGLVQCLRSEYPLIPSLKYYYQLKTSQTTSIQATQNRMDATTFSDQDFLLINIMDTHGPYEPPKAYQETDRRLKPELEDGLTNSVDNQTEIRQAYDGCAQYLSDAYQKLFSDLIDEFDYVITLADHGEQLGEHGLWGHGYGLYPEVTHIPLIISGRDVPSKTVDEVASIVDIHQTIADIANVEVDSRGQNLLQELKSIDRLIEYHGFSQNRRERFEEASIQDQYELMDRPLDAIVSSDGYAHETHEDGLKVSGQWSHDEAAQRLNNLVSTIDREQILTHNKEISDEIQERLEDLGYA